jgi:predicted TIM-barrel fold metal-dependent hydrolase
MEPLIDAHCHIFPQDFQRRRDELLRRDATFSELFSQGQHQLATAETLISAMDQNGIGRAVVMGIGWTDLALAQEANDCLIRAVADRPGRLTGLCSVNPGWGQPGLDEIERCAAHGLKGVGELHPDTQGFDIADGDSLAPLMELAAGLAMPVLVHCSEPAGHQYPGKGGTTPGKVYRFIENFPGNQIICAHWGGGLPFYGLMPEVPEVLKNVYFDSAASPFLYRPGVYQTVAGLVGPEKILFGTDYPLIGYSKALGHLAESGLEEVDRSAILGGNAARLFGV